MSLFDEIANENIYSDNMPEVIREYMRDDCVSDENIKQYWKRAVSYIEGYTGLEREELEKIPDAVHAMLAIVNDMHDNRQLNTERSYINELVDSILGMHRKNLVPVMADKSERAEDKKAADSVSSACR